MDTGRSIVFIYRHDDAGVRDRLHVLLILTASLAVRQSVEDGL